VTQLEKDFRNPVLDASVRQAVANALGKVGDARAVEPLLAQLSDPTASVRQAVINALVRIGDPRAVEPLLARLNDPDADVQPRYWNRV